MGTRKAPGLDPETTARKVAAMSLGRAQAREARLAAEAQLLSEVTALGLEELRRRATMRQWLCAMGECSGATEPELARLLGLKGGAVSVHRLRKHPVVRRLVALIQDHQLALVAAAPTRAGDDRALRAGPERDVA